jgi:hypothetical protein
MSFYLVKLVPDPNNPGQMMDEPIPGAGPYDTGPQAAAAAKAAQTNYSEKVQPRRMRQAGDWRPRMKEAQLACPPLPKEWDLPDVTDHFAHLDPVSRCNIRFVENDELGVIGRFTLLSPGRYISRYFPEVDDDHRRRLIAAVDPSGEIHFAITPEEIAEIYKWGPGSCMDAAKGRDVTWAKFSMWPPAVYGAGDFAVAYTRNERGSVQSRALCWPERKVFGRCYGDVQRMEKAMAAEGFKDIRQYGNGSYAGARLLKVKGADEHYYLMPYFDDFNMVFDMGDHFVVAGDEKEDGKILSKGTAEGQCFLQKKCPKERNLQPAHRFVPVQPSGEEWSISAAKYHARQCSATNEWWDRHKVITLIGGEYWSPIHFAEHGAHCDWTKQPCKKVDLVELSDGRKVHKDSVVAATAPAMKVKQGVDWGGRDYTDYRAMFQNDWSISGVMDDVDLRTTPEMMRIVEQALSRQLSRVVLNGDVLAETRNFHIANDDNDNEVTNAA